MNITSLGASLLARNPSKTSSAFLLGGIAVYHLTDNGTKPGANAGFGLEVPLTFFVGNRRRAAPLRAHGKQADADYSDYARREVLSDA